MALFSSSQIELPAFTATLEAWLAGGERGLTNPKVLTLKHASDVSGYSNETLLCKVEHGAGAARLAEILVFRLPPSGEGLFESYDMAWQFKIMDRLRTRAGFATPPCRRLETDEAVLGRPFFVMDFVDGKIPGDSPPFNTAGWVVEATDEQRSRLWWSSLESLVTLSKVDWRGAGLEFVDWPDRTRSRIEQQIELCDATRIRSNKELPDIDIPVIREMGRWLRMNRPAEEDASLVWGDCRFGNYIYRDFKPVAHLDWEWATVGDPILDLSYFLLMDRYFRVVGAQPEPIPQLGGFAGEEETIERYAQLAGKPVRNFDYYWVLNAFKVYAWGARFAVMHFKQGRLTLEEASLSRTVPQFAPYVFERISKV